ncbi:MAG: hypothetical protein DI563_22350 [Variovorax paradoxus]|uniref:Tyr recombinase domain-containing protein n=1 Tax=Variovorax paradoxus TaxID=34073 RepID=A0A2W5PPP3_VARPD|nr:MAG: hypothetical protein DI563_22350 [Variovorax paradoxus]
MASVPTPIPGLTRRRQTFFLTVVKPRDLRRDPGDRYAFRATLGTRDEAVARIKAQAIKADLEAEWMAERDRRRPQPTMPATMALADMLGRKLRQEVMEADDLNRLAGKPLEHLPFLPDELRTVSGDMFQQVENVHANVSSHAEALRWCLAAGQLDPFLLLLAQTLDGTGLPPIDWDTDPGPFMRFAQEAVTVYADLARRAAGEVVPTPSESQSIPVSPEVPAFRAPVVVSGPTWAELQQDWEAAKVRKAPAIKVTTRAIREFTAVCPGVQPAEVVRGHAATYRAALVAQGLRGTSVRNLISPLVSLLNLAVDSGKLATNPWVGVKVDTSDSVKRLPWRLEQLKALAAVNNTRSDGGRWLLPLLLYTGCRLGEVAQLEVADVREIDGVYAIEIHDMAAEGHEARTVKTAAGLRVVPVHPHLLALGFREHLEALKAGGERFVFPEFIQAGKKRPSELAGRYFLSLRREAGIPEDERFSAHSTRHNVRSALAAANANDTNIDKLIGHESGTVQSRYNHASMPGLVQTVGYLDWAGVGFRAP